MSIWFYLFLVSLMITIITLIITIILFLKLLIFKQELTNITKSLTYILKTDTNNLITISSSNRALKEFVKTLNTNLKLFRKLKLEYDHGSTELKNSITNISHDLRTPLTAIRGYLDLLDTSNLSNKNQNYLTIIDHKVNDLIELTDELFDFSTSLDISKEILKENICLNSFLEDTLAEFYSLFKKYNLNPQINICKEPIYYSLNKNMLKRVLENIISNALKYGEKTFIITLKNTGELSFSNLTYDLDFTSVKKLFNRYYTVKNAKKSTGIGLSIAKQLVDIMGGNITATYQNNYLTITIKF